MLKFRRVQIACVLVCVTAPTYSMHELPDFPEIRGNNHHVLGDSMVLFSK
jgi:hypothetical protein